MTNVSNKTNFLDQFKAVVESYELPGGSIGNDDGLLEELEDTNDIDHPGEIPKTDADDVRE